MNGSVLALSTYPIKGLSAVSHQSIDVMQGEGFPGDRIFGFAKGNSGFDPANPEPLPKSRFLALYGYEALALLSTEIDPLTRQLRIGTPEGDVHQFDLSDADSARDASAFFNELLQLPEAEFPVFASAAPHRFTDVSVTSHQMMHAISLINLASVDALAQKVGHPIEPERFRGNILIDGWPPFAELDLIGQQITLGGMAYDVLKRTRRCPATQVNPVTAERDLEVPRLIRQHYGHADMGIYIQAAENGTLHCGDTASVG